MFESICVVGAGCVGEAAAARLAGQVPTRTTGRDLDCGDADLVLLCVPDRAIAEVAAAVPRGPWVAHTSGAVSVTRLEPHRRRCQQRNDDECDFEEIEEEGEEKHHQVDDDQKSNLTSWKSEQ